MAMCALYRGDPDRALELLPETAGGQNWQEAIPPQVTRAWFASMLGEEPKAREELVKV